MFDYLHKTLDNNLRLVFVPMKTTSLAVKLLVGVGSKNESPKIRGISHFLEHMAFKGTKKRPNAIQIREEIERIGAWHNASTSKEGTSYWIKSIPEKLEFMFDLISDIVFNPLFKEEEINRERGVIVEEFNMYQDTPIDKVEDLFEKCLFGNTHLGWEIIGEKKTLAGINQKTFVDYQKKFYHPSNMVLAVAGGWPKKDWSKLANLAQKYFGSYQDKKVAKRKITFKENFGKKNLETKTTEQVHLILGLPSFKLTDDRRWPLNFLRMILAGNSISRLWVKIREERGWVYYLYPYVDFYQETGVFGIKLGLRSDKVKEAIELIENEMVNFADTVTEKELKDAKSCIKGQFLLSLEEPSRVAGGIGATWLLEGKIRTFEESLKLLQKVSLSEVKELARELFAKGKFSIAAIGPKGTRI